MWTNINALTPSSSFTLYIIQTGYHAGSPSTPTLEYFVNITSTTNSPVTHEHMEGWDGGSDGRRKRRCNGAIGSSCDRAAGVIVFLGLPSAVSVSVSLSLSRFSTPSLLCQSLTHFDTHQQTCIFRRYQFSLFSLHLKSNFPSRVCEWSHGTPQSDEVVPLPACQSSHMLHRHTKQAVASCLTLRTCHMWNVHTSHVKISFSTLFSTWTKHSNQIWFLMRDVNIYHKLTRELDFPHLKHCY